MTPIARVVIADGKGRFLALHHWGDPHNVGFPGGHVESGESFEDTARRELREETGLHATCLVPLCRIQMFGRDTMMFLAEAKGRIQSSSEGPLFWETPQAFVDGKHSEFSKRVFDALNRR